jgi:peptidoglycan hydrolase-like protein with peptidoglycan-binding domain
MTPDRLNSRVPKSILLALLAVFALGVLVPSASASSSRIGVSLRGLQPGTSGPAVRTLQRSLARLGYAVKADGQFGKHTAQVVRRFRADVGLPRSSRVTTRFVRMLKRAQNGGRGDNRWLGIRRLAMGARGHDVRLLQNDLTKLGFTAVADGQFGPQTRLSVRMFERSAGLQVSGVISPRQARALKRIAAKGLEAGAVSTQPTQQQPLTTSTATQTTGPATTATTPTLVAAPTGQVATPPPAVATIGADGLAVAPAGAPAAVVAIIQAGNEIAFMPYRFGGGHETWKDTGYDCSGSVSFALHGAGLLDTPLSSYDFPTWGATGPGQWVTIYANASHAYMIVAGIRFDTSASKNGGSRWTAEPRSPAGYVAVHPAGL